MKTFMFVVLAAMFVLSLNIAVAQVQDLHLYTAEVAPAGLVLAVGTTDYAALNGGVCYTAPANPTGLAPNIDPFTVAEDCAQAPSLIDADPFTTVLVSFVMPTVLTDNANYLATMSYDGTSACWSNDGDVTVAFFNPQGATVPMDCGAGEIEVFLGGNICTPKTAAGASLLGQAIITVQYQ